MQLFEKNDLIKHLVVLDERAAMLQKTAPELLDDVVMASGGKIGTALKLLSAKKAESAAEERRIIEQILYAMQAGESFTKIHSALSMLPQSKAEFSDSVETLITAIRDIILLRLSENAPLVFYSSKSEAVKLASAMETKRLISLYDIISAALADISKNVPVSTIVADVSAKIKLL